MQRLVSLAEVQLGDMPNAETLKSMNLKQFDSRATPGEVASKTASAILSQLGGNTPQTQEPQKAGAKLIQYFGAGCLHASAFTVHRGRRYARI